MFYKKSVRRSFSRSSRGSWRCASAARPGLSPAGRSCASHPLLPGTLTAQPKGPRAWPPGVPAWRRMAARHPPIGGTIAQCRAPSLQRSSAAFPKESRQGRNQMRARLSCPNKIPPSDHAMISVMQNGSAVKGGKICWMGLHDIGEAGDQSLCRNVEAFRATGKSLVS